MHDQSCAPTTGGHNRLHHACSASSQSCLWVLTVLPMGVMTAPTDTSMLYCTVGTPLGALCVKLSTKLPA